MNITLAIRATDDHEKVVSMIALLRREGLLTDEKIVVENRPSKFTPALAKKKGPYELKALTLPDAGKCIRYTDKVAAVYPSKEDYCKALVEGSVPMELTESKEVSEGEGSVFSGSIEGVEPDENEYD